MKKETKIITLIAACIVIAFVAMALIFGGGGKVLMQVGFAKEITVEDGIANPAVFSQQLAIPKSGNYQSHFEWTSQPGLITGARLLDAKGQVLFYLTGESVDADMKDIFLEEGSYVLEFYPLASPEEFKAFIADSSERKQDGSTVYDAEGNASAITGYEFAENGSFYNAYSYEIVESRAFNQVQAVSIVLGVIIGLILAAFLLIVTKKDKKIEAEYDEMQQAARGKGYCIGFWTAVIYFMAVSFSDAIGIQIPAENSVITIIGIFLSMFTFVVYCIRTDAYFAMNENRKSVYIVFLVVGIINLGLGAMNIMGGYAVADGMLTFRSINLICGIFLAAVGIVLGLKNVGESREEE